MIFSLTVIIVLSVIGIIWPRAAFIVLLGMALAQL